MRATESVQGGGMCPAPKCRVAIHTGYIAVSDEVIAVWADESAATISVTIPASPVPARSPPAMASLERRKRNPSQSAKRETESQTAEAEETHQCRTPEGRRGVGSGP